MPEEPLGVDGLLTPRLKSIDAAVPDGVYGAGDVISITLQFYSEVNVSGIPTLTVNTGCHSEVCTTKEIQQFHCAADLGFFAIRMENQFIMNVNVNTTQDQLKYKLEELRGVNEVAITFNETDDRPFSGGKRVCTSLGNVVTVIFESTSFPEYDGDVPPMYFDDRNRFPELRTGLYQGLGDDSRLRGVHQAYEVNLSSVSVELQKGVQQQDGIAFYERGSGTNTLTFVYTVRSGDFSLDLDVLSINFVDGYIYSPLTMQNVSTALPGPQVRSRYMNGSPASLSYARGINISTDVATVVKVTSPDPNGVYTVGDTIDIAVYFDLPVKVYGDVFLQLKPGSFLRRARFLSLDSVEKKIIIFQYKVEMGDFADDLDYFSTGSINLNGGFIYRASFFNDSVVDLTLPPLGSEFSLAGQKDIIVETSPPVVLNFYLTQTGLFTSGDTIDFHLRYNQRVVVDGEPILWVQNSPRQLNAQLQTAPYVLDWHFYPATAGGSNEAVFIYVNFVLNWELYEGDHFDIYLPGFVGSDVSVLSLGGKSSSLLTGSWESSSETLQIFVRNSSVTSATEISFVVDARNGVSIGPAGVTSSLSEIILTVWGAGEHTFSAAFQFIQSVGFSDISLVLSTPMPGTFSRSLLRLSTPDLLSVDDTLTLYFKGFSSNRSVTTVTTDGVFRLKWDKNQRTLELVVITPVASNIVDIELTDYFPLVTPELGCSRFSVEVEAEMIRNGIISSRPISNATSVCSAGRNNDNSILTDVNVVYDARSRSEGSSAMVVFLFWSGLSGLAVGDSVTFGLPMSTFSGVLDTEISGNIRAVVDGVNLDVFSGAVSVVDSTIRFVAVDEVPPAVAVRITVLADVKLKVPVIEKDSDSFSVFVSSSRCLMLRPQNFKFDYGILLISSPTLVFSDSATLEGTPVTALLTFDIDVPVEIGDTFTLTLPGFSRDIELSVYDNSSVVGIFPVSLVYHKAADQIEFTALERYNIHDSVTGLYSLSFTLSIGYGLLLPPDGFPFEAARLSIDAAQGTSMNNQITNDCVGFCGGSVSINVPFANTATNVKFHTIFSENLSIGSNVTLMNIDDFDISISITQLRLGVGTWIPASHSVELISDWYEIPWWRDATGAMVLSLPCTIEAEKGWILSLSDVRIIRSGVITGITIGTVSSTLKPSGSDVKFWFDTPAIFPDFAATRAYLSFKRSDGSVTFENKLSGEYVDLFLDFEFGDELSPGYAIDVSFTGFEVGSSGYTIDVHESGSYISARIGGTWSCNASRTLAIPIYAALPAHTVINFTIRGLVSPSSGVIKGSDASPIYAVRVSNESFSPPRELTLTQDILAVYNISVYLNYVDSGMLDVSSFAVSLITNRDLIPGDSLEIFVPGLVGIDLQPLSLSGLAAYAVYTEKDSHDLLPDFPPGFIKLVVTSVVPSGQLVFVISCFDGASSRILFLPSKGFSRDNFGIVLLYIDTEFRGIVFPYSLPCFGICFAHIDMPFPKAGFNTDLDVEVNVHNFLSVGDILSFELPGFVRSWDGTDFVNSYYNNVVRNDILLRWNTTSSTLILTILQLKESTSTLSFSVLRFEGLILPSNGIRVEERYGVSYASNTSDWDRFRSFAMTIAPVGIIHVSSVEIPVRTVGVEVDVKISLKLGNIVKSSDIIKIVLPSFTIPNSSHVVTATLQGSDAATASRLLLANCIAGTFIGDPAIVSLSLLDEDTTLEPNELVTIILEKRSFHSVLPSQGLQEWLRPQIEIISATSPVILSPVLNYTAVGALSPASLSFFHDRFDSVLKVITMFTVKCPWEDGAILSIHLSNVYGATNAVLDVSLSYMNEVMDEYILESSWDNLTSSILLTINGSAISNGEFFVEISSADWFLTNEIVHRDCDGYYYYFSVDSVTCPIDPTEFSTSAGTILSTSALMFGNPVANKVSSVSLAFQPLDLLQAGDIVTLNLPNFNTTSCVDICIVIHEVNPLFSSNVGVEVLGNSIIVSCTLVEQIFAGGSITLEIPDFFNITIPSDGVRLNKESGATIGVYYGTTLDRFFAGPVEYVQAIGVLSVSSLVLNNPVSGSCSDFVFNFEFPFSMNVDHTISLSVPGFSMTVDRTDEPVYAVSIYGNATRYYAVHWMPHPATFVFTVLESVPADILLSMITSEDCIRVPISGIAALTEIYTVSVESNNGNIIAESVAFISIVPHIEYSSIGFTAALSSQVYANGGTIDENSVLLVPGHDLNDMDVGSSVVIDGTMYTITSCIGNKLTFAEQYQGPVVFLSEPVLYVNTSELRPALYFSGSGTEELTFRYVARRGDVSDEISVYNIASDTNIWVTEELELNGGSMLRLSENPELPVDRSLPELVGGRGLSIDAVRPSVIRISSTSIGNSAYTAHSFVDFQVHFSHAVSVNESVPAAPGLLLHKISDDSIGIARYSSGSGTSTLTFVWKVLVGDNVDVSTHLIGGNAIVQPLRAIMNNYFDYIRRASTYPTLDIYENISNAVNDIDRNISVASTAPKISEVFVKVAEDGSKTFSAGDTIYIYVRYSTAVRVELIDPDGAVPTLLLDLQGPPDDTGYAFDPGVARFTRMLDDRTLVFEYFVIPSDSLLQGGLYYHCDCADYFRRSFIKLNENAIILSEHSDASRIPASLLVASSAYSVDRMIDVDVVVDNITPAVKSVSANVTRASVLVPGSTVSVYVEFSHRVEATGNILLLMHSARRLYPSAGKFCTARLIGGSGTSTLEFLYVVSLHSASSGLACTGADSIDLSGGSIKRYSAGPIINADVSLPTAGSYGSLGYNTDVVIDSSPLFQTGIFVEADKILPASSFSVYQVFASSNDSKTNLFYHYGQGRIRFDSAFGTELDASLFLTSSLEDSAGVDVSTTYSDGKYKSMLVQSLSLRPLLSVSTLSTSSVGPQTLENALLPPWWSRYNTIPYLDIYMEFDRSVHARDKFLLLNTGPILNRAVSSMCGSKWLVSIDVFAARNFFKSEKESAERSNFLFRLKFGDSVTPCISVRSDGGEKDKINMAFEMQSRLRSLPVLRKRGVRVSPTPSVRDGLLSFSVTTERGGTESLLVLDEIGYMSCGDRSVMPSLISVAPDARVCFRYPVKEAGMLLLQVKEDVPVGSINIKVESYKSKLQGYAFRGRTVENGFSVGALGITSNSIRLEHLSGRTMMVRSSRILRHSGLLAVPDAALYFHNSIPGHVTGLTASFTVSSEIYTGSIVELELPGSTSSLSVAAQINAQILPGGNFEVYWNSSTDTATLTCLSTQPAQQPFTIHIDDSVLQLVSSSSASYENSKTPSFSLMLFDDLVEKHKFSFVSAIGFRYFTLDLTNPKPGQYSGMYLRFVSTFDLPFNSTIRVCLPGFLRENIQGNNTLDLSGSFSHVFSAEWRNSSSSLYLVNYLELSAHQEYSLLVDQSNRVAIAAHGVSGDGAVLPAPSVSMEAFGSNFGVVDTVLSGFTRVFGLLDSQVSVEVIESAITNQVAKIGVSLNFSKIVQGPFDVLVKIPCLRHIDNTVTVNVSMDAFDVHSNSAIFLVWHGCSENLRLSVPSSFNHSSFLFSWTPANESFSVCENGIPARNHGVSVTIQGVVETDSANGAEHEVTLVNFPVHSVSIIPVIKYSSIRFKNVFIPPVRKSRSNPFVPGYYKPDIHILVTVNTAILPGDIFDFVLFGVQRSDQVMSELVLDGPSSTYITAEFIGDSVLRVHIFNESRCCTEHFELDFTISAVRNSGYFWGSMISQFSAETFKIFWNNSHRDFGFIPVHSPPVFGVVHSAIEFEHPFGGAETTLSFTLITETNLSRGDALLLTLPDIDSPGQWQVHRVLDNSGREWELSWSADLHLLSLIAPTFIPPTGLSFSFGASNNLPCILPVLGIRKGSPEFTIGIKFADDPIKSFFLSRPPELLPQHVMDVPAVGSILSGHISLVQLPLSAPISMHSQLDITIDLILSQELLIGDVVAVSIPSLLFRKHDFLLFVSGEDGRCFQVRTDSVTESLIFETLCEVVDNNISLIVRSDGNAATFRMPSSPLVCYCAADCKAIISVSSLSCPVAPTRVVVLTIRPFESPALRFNRTMGVPVDMRIQFTALYYLPVGLKVALHLDGAVELSSFTSADISVFGVKESPVWDNTWQGNSFWDGAWDNDTSCLTLTLLESINASVNAPIILRVVSRNLSLVEGAIVYETNSFLSYDVRYGTLAVIGNAFTYVDYAAGLFDASVFADSTSPFSVIFKFATSPAASTEIGPDDSFLPLDNVTFHLPGYDDFSNAVCNVEMVTYWDETLSELTFTVMETASDVMCNISVSKLGVACSDTFSCGARVSMRKMNILMDTSTFFGPSYLRSYSPLRVVSSGNFALVNSSRAGYAADIELNFSLNFVPMVSDYVEILLPKFWSSAVMGVTLGATPCLNKSISCYKYSIEWDACSETIFLLFSSVGEVALVTSATSHSITVRGLRLPRVGINEVLSNGLTMKAGVVGQGDSSYPPVVLESVPRVGYFPYAAVFFLQPVLNGVTGISISFELCKNLYPGESIRITLPGASFQQGDGIIKFMDGSIASNISVSWLSSTNELTLTATTIIARGVLHNIVVGNESVGFSIESSGFPAKNSEIMISSDSIDAPVGWTPIGVETSADVRANVGIIQESTDIRFTLTGNSVSAPISSVALRFQFSHKLSVGDEITIVTPSVVSEANCLLPIVRSDVDNVDLVSFNVSFNSLLREISVIILTNQPAFKIVSLAVQPLGILLIDHEKGTAGVDHFIRANISAMGGRLNDRRIDHFPNDIIGISSNGTEVAVSCSYGGNSQCELNLNIQLKSPIVAGDFIAVSHRSFFKEPYRSLFDPQRGVGYLRDSTTSSVLFSPSDYYTSASVDPLPPPDSLDASIAAAIDISGSESMYFSSYWRNADKLSGVNVVSTRIEDVPFVASDISKPEFVAQSDLNTFPIDSHISVSFPDHVAIVAEVAHVTDVYAIGTIDCLVPGDSLLLNVQFSEPVSVVFDFGNFNFSSGGSQAEAFGLRILFNSGEVGHYHSGAGTRELKFVYHITRNGDNVTDLAIAGPHAIDFASRGGRIVFGSMNSLSANTTIPSSFVSSLLRSNYGIRSTIKISASECSAHIVSAEVYSRPGSVDETYTFVVGDVLDIIIYFDRDVVVVPGFSISEQGVLLLDEEIAGVRVYSSTTAKFSEIGPYPFPSLFIPGLIGNDPDRPSLLQLNFVNVSRVQWLHVYSDGDFSVSVDGYTSACIEWDDVESLLTELKKLASLEFSLPVLANVYPIVNGLKYELIFEGKIAPALLHVQKHICGRQSLSAFVSLPPSALKSLVFRRIISVEDFSYNAAEAGVAHIGRDDITTYMSHAGVPISGSTYPQLGESIIYTRSPMLLTEANKILPEELSVDIYDALSFRIDSSPPAITCISSSFLGRHGQSLGAAGDTIIIYVHFSRSVIVTGSPTLQVNITVPSRDWQSVIPFASYIRTMGNIVHFAYRVRPGDISQMMSINGPNSLSLNGGSIRSEAVMSIADADLSIDTACSLEMNNIMIDGTLIPTLNSIGVLDLAAGSYGAGQSIIIALLFPSVVYIEATDTLLTPSIRLNVSNYDSRAYYSSGSGSKALLFEYNVRPGDYSPSLSFEYPNISMVVSPEFGCFEILGGVLNDTFGNAWTTIADCPYNTGLELDFDLSYLSFNYEGGFELFLNIISRLKTTINNLVIDTSTPTVTLVTSNNEDGTYQPGQVIDITVHFDKEVVLHNTNEVFAPPQLALFIPYQDFKDIFAVYSYGNGTSELHFSYLIPLPPESWYIRPLIRLDYAGTASLLEHLNGWMILRRSTVPTTVANVLLPAEDVSFLGTVRDIRLDFNSANIEYIAAINASGTYTAGDTVLIEVKFSQPVMVIIPPVLRLETGQVDRDAVYVSGNNTACLFFKYIVMAGDQSSDLDYVDTRLVPYEQTTYQLSFALDTDILKGNNGRLRSENNENFLTRQNDIVFLSTRHGGVFRSSTSSTLIGVFTAFPLPGTAGSLSHASNININTKPNNVTKTFTTVPNGCYGSGALITFSVSFDSAVEVNGCPSLLFFINNRDRYAVYSSGSGTSILNFEMTLSDDDVMFEVDYIDRYSLQLKKCAFGEQSLSEADPYIKRHSQEPRIDSNLTLGWVKYVESIVSPTSITGGGQDLRFVGTSVRPDGVYVLENAFEPRAYGIGDLIDVNIRFTRAVSLSNMGPRLYFKNISHPAYYEHSVNSSIFVFRVALQADDICFGLSYDGEFALRTDKKTDITYADDKSRCAAQNLHRLLVSVPGGDSLPTDRITISSEDAHVIGLAFADNSAPVRIGSVLHVLVEFSHGVVVEGRPYLTLFSDPGDRQFNAFFVNNSKLSANVIQFDYTVAQSNSIGIIKCGSRSTINLNGGYIRRYANFLPILPSSVNIGALCCALDCNSVSVRVVDSTPRIIRVFSSTNGTYSHPDVLDIYIEWSHPVYVTGVFQLVLNIRPDYPAAKFVGVESPTMLKFSYTVRSIDSTADLDYTSIHSLVRIASNGSTDAGIFLRNDGRGGILVESDLTLPSPASVGSLGSENDIVLDSKQARIVSVSTTPSIVTAGDILTFHFMFSDIVAVHDKCEAKDCPDFLYVPFNITVADSGIVHERVAQKRVSALGSDTVSFTYLVSVSDPSGSISIGLSIPFFFNNAFPEFLTVLSGIKSSSTIPVDSVSTELAVIDNARPVVLKVYSPNSSAVYPFGTGDIIDLFVEMSAPVIAVSGTAVQLLLRLSNKQPVGATFVDSVLNINRSAFDGVYEYMCSEILHFQYRVRSGDMAIPLQYYSENALSGDLRRCSIGKNPLIPAILTLPVPFSTGSLSSCCRLQIDTTPPYIESIIPLKRPGIYGKNENILIVVRFNRPVILRGGSPMLLLQSGRDGSAGNATYIDTFTEPDILLDITATDIIFQYVIREQDYTSSLHHFDEHSFFLNGASLFAYTTNPEEIVDTSLRDPLDFALELGRVDRQWKYKFPKRIDVVMRDFYSSAPQRLSAKLEHSSGETIIFHKCCEGSTFGKPFPLSRLGNNASVYDVDTAIGYDYLFSDTQSMNLALTGSANQSSVQYNGIPYRAIDGINSPALDDGSVTATFDTDVNAWWQVRLGGDEMPTIRSIMIWGRKDQIWVPAVVAYVVKGYDRYPRGKYQLKVMLTKSNTEFLISDHINMGVSAEDVSVALGKLDGLQQISVSRELLTGVFGYEKGLGWKYRITFNSLKTTHPALEVVNVVLEGALHEVPNHVDYHTDASYSSMLERRGRVVTSPTKETTKNKWLTPFWILIFDDSVTLPPESLEESIAAAIWKKLIVEIEDPIQLNLEISLSARYVKIQRTTNGSLSLAEVEVYSESIDSLEWYRRGSPIVPAPPMRPYQTHGSLKHEFSQLQYVGRWILQIDDDGVHAPLKRYDGSSGGDGSISDWVLIVTDMAGIVYPYYMDLRAEILTLPKYGDLYDAKSMIETAGYGDWMDAFVIEQGPRIAGRIGGNRFLGPCYGLDTSGDGFRFCHKNFGVGPLLASTLNGDVSNNYTFLRNERLVAYKPKLRYEGPDYFTYRIFDGQNIQEHTGVRSEALLSSRISINEVTLHVRNCRLYAGSKERHERQMVAVEDATAFKKRIIHPLCPCRSTEYDIIGNVTSCITGYDAVCSSNYSRYHFLNLCLVCGGYSDRRKFSEACILEIIRAVSFVTQRGFCDTKPPMDCSSELISLPGREAVNYLSLRPYTLHGSYTQLGNGIGGYGWYESAYYV